MESTVLEFPGREVTTKALTWPDRARAIRVVDADSYVAAADLLKGIKALRAEVADTFNPHIQAAHQQHKNLLAEKAKADAPLNEAEGLVKRALATYDAEQERIRREEQRKRDEEARRREEDERLAKAAAMETEGRAYGDDTLVAEAHALIDEPAPPVTAAPVAKATPKVAGVSYREVWQFEVTDAAKVPREYLVVDEKAIGAVVRGLKGRTQIPGVRVYSERVIAASGR